MRWRWTRRRRCRCSGWRRAATATSWPTSAAPGRRRWTPSRSALSTHADVAAGRAADRARDARRPVRHRMRLLPGRAARTSSTRWAPSCVPPACRAADLRRGALNDSRCVRSAMAGRRRRRRVRRRRVLRAARARPEHGARVRRGRDHHHRARGPGPRRLLRAGLGGRGVDLPPAVPARRGLVPARAEPGLRRRRRSTTCRRCAA